MDEFPVLIADASDPLLIIGIAWLAILSMLAWGLVAEVWHLLRGRERVLFVHMPRTCARWCSPAQAATSAPVATCTRSSAGYSTAT